MEKVLDLQYKNRQPQETIKIIDNFFKEKGFTVDVISEMKTEANTYACHIELFYKGQFFGFSNGKGMTKELSLASGYAELYERFCNRCPNVLWKKNNFVKFCEYSKEKNGYCFDPEERTTSIKDLMQEDYIKEAFVVDPELKDFLELTLNAILDVQHYDVPYTSALDSTKRKWFNPLIIQAINGTTGMAAGNNFEEAFVQCMAEIFERYCSFDSMAYEEGIDYCSIDLNSFKGTHLDHIIKSIQDKGRDVYIIDLSYEYELPVVLGVVVNKETHSVRIDFASHPIFEIAAERTITEAYQNLDHFDAKGDDMIQIPYRALNIKRFLINTGMNFGHYSLLPPNFFSKLKQVDSYNKDIFLPKTSTKEDCYIYTLQIIKDKNLNVYYRNVGLCKDMTAINIFIDNLPLAQNSEKGLLDINKDNYDLLKYELKCTQDFRQMILNDEYKVPEGFYEDYRKFMELPGHIKSVGSIIGGGDQVTPVQWNKTSLREIYDMFGQYFNYEETVFTFKGFAVTPFYNGIKKYHILRRYKGSANGYTDDEIKFILGNLGIEVSEDDLKYYDNPSYICEQILFKKSWQIFHSELFQEMLRQAV